MDMKATSRKSVLSPEELRRISDVQLAVAQQRSADALARAASRGPNAA